MANICHTTSQVCSVLGTCLGISRSEVSSKKRCTLPGYTFRRGCCLRLGVLENWLSILGLSISVPFLLTLLSLWMSCCLFSACLSEGAWQAQTPELDLSHGRGAGGNKHVWSTNQPPKKHISTKKPQICAQPKHLQTSFRPHSDLIQTSFQPHLDHKPLLKLI